MKKITKEQKTNLLKTALVVGTVALGYFIGKKIGKAHAMNEYWTMLDRDFPKADFGIRALSNGYYTLELDYANMNKDRYIYIGDCIFNSLDDLKEYCLAIANTADGIKAGTYTELVNAKEIIWHK